MTITRNTDGSYSAYQRAQDGTACVAEGITRGDAAHRCARLALERVRRVRPVRRVAS
jgi:hypothetical protein